MFIRRLCSVLIQLAAAVSFARAQDVPKGEAAFTEYVAAQLRRELKGARVEVKGSLTLLVGGGLQANLGRIFTYCSDNADGCRSEISAYVKGVARLHNGRIPPPSRGAVRIIVRNNAYVRGDAEMQWRPLVGELVMLPAMDAPQAILSPMIVPYRATMQPDTTAMIFWLKNRRPDRWRDVHKVEHGDVNAFDQMTNDELRQYIAEETKALGIHVPSMNGRGDGTKH